MKTFQEIYDGRPDQREVGSSGYSNMKNLYDICTRLKPELIVESGHWKSNSAWLFHHFCPVVSHDIQFDEALFEHPSITRVQDDISFYSYDRNALLFFDDHISQKKRIQWMIDGGYHYAVFDDNQPYIVANSLKNPAWPTLQELVDDEDSIIGNIKHYEVMPFHGNRRNFDNRLTFINL